MHIIFGKKQLLLAALVAILGLAVFINWYCSGSGGFHLPGAPSEEAESRDSAAEYVNGLTEEEYFASVKLTRDNARDDALEELQAVIANAGDDGEAAAASQKAIEEIGEQAKMESDIESLVAGKTGSGCVAVISEDSVDVVVSGSALNDGNVLTISDVISQVCGDRYENIRISGTMA